MKKKILIIEDDQFLRDFYMELLSAEGYQIDVAGDGDTAFAKIKQGGWDLIMLDIMLPKKDGIQILKDLKDQNINPSGPILVLTNLGNDTIVNECFALGAAGYLIKSAMNPDEVLIELHNYLNKQP